MTTDTTPPDENWVAIAPMRPQLTHSYWQCLASVIREKKYLHSTEPPSLEQSREDVAFILGRRFPMLVAFVPGPQVVGWCEIWPSKFQSLAHIGTVVLGIRHDFRGQGLGRLLLQQALRHAQTMRLERIELEVYSSNQRAQRLYESLGFEVEGTKRRARKVDGVYDDIHLMVKFLK